MVCMQEMRKYELTLASELLELEVTKVVKGSLPENLQEATVSCRSGLGGRFSAITERCG
jgi:hypothetical protein